MDECLKAGMHEFYGVWGGLSETERREAKHIQNQEGEIQAQAFIAEVRQKSFKRAHAMYEKSGIGDYSDDPLVAT